MDPEPRQVPKPLLYGYFGLVAFSLIGMVASRLFHLESSSIATGASLAVLLTGALCVAWLIGRPERVIGLLFVSGCVEAVGVVTGIPFGAYRYTTAWWPTVPLTSDRVFPLGVPFAWLLVVGGLWLTVGESRGWRRVLTIGLAATLLDVALEDLAIHSLGYWTWFHPGPVFGAPLVNSLGWLATAFATASILGEAGGRSPNRTGSQVLAAYCLLMTMVAALDFRPSLAVWVVLTGLLARRGLRNARAEAI